MRIIVVGAGIHGLCVAWACARAGHQVLVLEAGPLPNPRSSSLDHNRLIRYPYGAMGGYVELVRGAFEGWARVWQDLGAIHYAQTGSLAYAYKPGDWTHAAREQLALRGIPHETLEAREVERRFPTYRAEGVAWALRTDSGGVLAAERIVRGLAEHLRARDGVVLREHAKVVDVDAAAGRVTLHGNEALAADRVVVCAGAWVGALVPALAPRAIPSRQVIVYLQPASAQAAEWAEAPMLLDIAEGGVYAVPPRMGTPMKVADHRFSMAGHPERERDPREEEVAALVDAARGRVVGVDAMVRLQSKTCFYTVADGERFIAHEDGALLVVSACSGHGFKFGPAVGEAVARVMGGERDAAWLQQKLSGECAGEG